MNNELTSSNTLIGIGVIGFVLLLGFLMFRNTSVQEMAQNNSATSTEKVATSTTGGATQSQKKPVTATQPIAQSTPAAEARKILTAAGNTQCIYEQIAGGARSTNKLFLSGGKARGEFYTFADGNSKGTIMVYDGANIYTWTEGFGNGQKTTLKAVSDIARLIPNNTSLAMILGKSADGIGWNCFPWIVDASKLAPPTYIKF